LCQRDDRTLVLRLAMQGAEAAHAAARCRTALQNFAVIQALMPIRVIVKPGQTLPKGRSGKVQRVVAHPNPKPNS